MQVPITPVRELGRVSVFFDVCLWPQEGAKVETLALEGGSDRTDNLYGWYGLVEPVLIRLLEALNPVLERIRLVCLVEYVLFLLFLIAMS